jgi:hypothetical protein
VHRHYKGKEIQGFLAFDPLRHDLRFLDRRQAVPVARNSGIVLSAAADTLFSEDLW